MKPVDSKVLCSSVERLEIRGSPAQGQRLNILIKGLVTQATFALSVCMASDDRNREVIGEIRRSRY